MSNRGGLLANAELIEIDPADVEVGKRTGFLHEDIAIAIGRTMKAFGQRDPIKIRKNRRGNKPWLLVVGRHRLRGAELEGIKVWALVVSGAQAEMDDLEASENLHRRSMPPIERAMFVEQLCRAARERLAHNHGDLKQQQLAAKARWDRAKKLHRQEMENALSEDADDASSKLALAYEWRETAADALGLGKSAIHRSQRIFRLIIEPFPDFTERLAKHPVVGENESQLLKITRIVEEDSRRKVIEALLADPELSVDGARDVANVPDGEESPPSRDEVLLSRAIATLGRMRDDERISFIEHQVSDLPIVSKRRIYRKLAEEIGHEG